MSLARFAFLHYCAFVSLSACNFGGGDEGCLADWQCGVGAACEKGQCLSQERCGEVLCEAGDVCVDGACTASPYGKEYTLVLFEATASQVRTLQASVSVAGVQIASPTSAPGLSARWDLRAQVVIGPADALHVILRDPAERGLVDEQLDRVPPELLVDGERAFPGSGGTLVLRAFPVGEEPECLRDDECLYTEHCEDGTCVAGERCGAAICQVGQICESNKCIASVYDRPYTLTIVSASMNGNWDSGFAVEPDPMAFVYVGDEVILQGNERENTREATWNVSVTRTFDAVTPVRFRLIDVDSVDPFNDGHDIAIDKTFARLPYKLIKDGTLTLSGAAASLTVTLTAP